MTTYNANIIDDGDSPFNLKDNNNESSEEGNNFEIKDGEVDKSQIGELVNGIQEAVNSGATQFPIFQNQPTQASEQQIPQPQQQMSPPITQTQHQPQYQEQEPKKEDLLDAFFQKFKIPLCLAIIYYIFHTSVVNKCLFSCLTWTCSPNGNINNKGIITMSILFGGVYILLERVLPLFFCSIHNV